MFTLPIRIITGSVALMKIATAYSDSSFRKSQPLL